MNTRDETDHTIRPLNKADWPKGLLHIPQPPHEMWIQGTLPCTDGYVWLTIVGSRKATTYGKQVCEMLIQSLSGMPVIIVSGLALGIDGYTHTIALEAGLTCVAIPGSGLDPSVLAPPQHAALAERILSRGGCLLSPFPPTHPATPYTFPTRNRIMVGVSQAVLIIEATEKSGTLITARMATDYNRNVGVVPGSIVHPGSFGPHLFLGLGATPIYDATSLRNFLGFDTQPAFTFSKSNQHMYTPEEQLILAALTEPCTMSTLSERTKLSMQAVSVTITTLEIKEHLRCEGVYIIRIR
jgi:DNA processing protein